MPSVAPVPFAPFWGHDDDADPLAGGALYAFAAGTDTPLTTYANPQGTTLNPHPVVLDDAGYAQVYLHSGTPYKLRLVNNLGVQQWEIDQVYGAGAGGSSGLAGVGWGKNTVALTPTNGAATASAAVFPPDVLALGMTVWVQTGFGASQGLQAIGLGTPTLPEAWGVLDQFALDAASTAGMFLTYSGQPQPESGVVTLTAYGGLFDGTGTLYVTGHFYTLTPGHEVGYSYAPGVPETGQILPPQPPATESTPGLVELATSAETVTGTDPSRVVTPATLQAKLATLPLDPLTGTPLAVLRLSASGAGEEETPGLTTTSDGRLGVNSPPGAGDMLSIAATPTSATVTFSRAIESTGAPVVLLKKSRGTDAVPTRVAANDQLGSVHWSARTRDAADTADVDLVLAVVRAYVEAVDGVGRASSQLRFFTSEASGAAQERMRLSAAGWLGLLTTAPTAPLDITGNTLRLRTARTPASATAAGNQGDIAWDSSGIFVCIATNTWRKATLATF